MIDLTQLWLLIVIFTLFAFGMLLIVAGLKTEETPDNSEQRDGTGKNE